MPLKNPPMRYLTLPIGCLADKHRKTMFTYLKGKPVITYPCRWSYKLFGTDQDRMCEAVAQAVTGADYTLRLSRSSKHKKYHCMNLDIQVMSEQDRTEIFQALSSHKAFVLIL